ncbi:MAG: hypothetical protein ACP6IY_12085 [Promethearchaeia archaeon]
MRIHSPSLRSDCFGKSCLACLVFCRYGIILTFCRVIFGKFDYILGEFYFIFDYSSD